MKYLVIGAGGTGGCIGGYMSKAGKDVTLIARGKHLQAMKDSGLSFETPEGNWNIAVKASSMEEYSDTPDVIFVCVKGYSIDDIIPFIGRVSGDNTVVIPILNIYGTGKKLQEKLASEQGFKGHATDGCIYIASQIKEPGVMQMNGMIFKVVFGFRRDTDQATKDKYQAILDAVEKDLEESKITPILSKQIEKDTLQKFSFVSPMAAAGAHYNKFAKDFHKEGLYRDTFIKLINEVKALSDAMGVSLPDDIVETNLKILNGLAPESTTSMHRDILAGNSSEFDGLVLEVIRLGKTYGVPTPGYEEMAQK